jgi:hypothetical protein
MLTVWKIRKQLTMEMRLFYACVVGLLLSKILLFSDAYADYPMLSNQILEIIGAFIIGFIIPLILSYIWLSISYELE